jgi:CBS domain-containing protein
MTINGSHHLPVRRSDGALGVVSARDLLRYLCE